MISNLFNSDAIPRFVNQKIFDELVAFGLLSTERVFKRDIRPALSEDEPEQLGKYRILTIISAPVIGLQNKVRSTVEKDKAGMGYSRSRRKQDGTT